jgi:transcriptional regulator with XRE-family HTH domain
MASVPTGRFDHVAMRRIREERGLTQAQLAEILGMDSPDSVYEWESARSKPSITTLPNLAEALGVDVEKLHSTPGGRMLLGDLRIAAGLPQREFAKLMNARLRLPEKKKITQTRISNWEKAKTPIPDDYVGACAALLGVTVEKLHQAVQETWRSSRKVPGWTPPIDRRELEFKGVAAGHEELAFVYKMTSNVSAMVAILMAGVYSAHPGAEESKRQFSFLLWCQVYTLIQDVRDRAWLS